MAGQLKLYSKSQVQTIVLTHHMRDLAANEDCCIPSSEQAALSFFVGFSELFLKMLKFLNFFSFWNDLIFFSTSLWVILFNIWHIFPRSKTFHSSHFLSRVKVLILGSSNTRKMKDDFERLNIYKSRLNNFDGYGFQFERRWMSWQPVKNICNTNLQSKLRLPTFYIP